MSDAYVYDAAFQHMTATGSMLAARRIVGAVRAILSVRSVLDVGCARGTWLREWQARGVDDVLGLDGDYVDRGKLAIDPTRFVVRDLASSFHVGRQFDLAQSLEVAEHLPPARAASFIADLTAHAPVVLFSAAPPGQGGEHHVNEQCAEYWRDIFLAHNFVAIDCLRPLIIRDVGIPIWYKYNLMLYARRDNLDSISEFARQFQLNDDDRIPDISPVHYKFRKMLVRSLPKGVHDHLARWNARRTPEA